VDRTQDRLEAAPVRALGRVEGDCTRALVAAQIADLMRLDVAEDRVRDRLFAPVMVEHRQHLEAELVEAGIGERDSDELNGARREE
jgi:hypothetical protein